MGLCQDWEDDGYNPEDDWLDNTTGKVLSHSTEEESDWDSSTGSVLYKRDEDES